MTPVESWNAQISLLTGMAAASLMVYARVGILRTLPPADPRDVQRLHRTARALGIDWPAEQLYPDCCAARGTSPSTGSFPSSRSTPPSPPSTPTSPRPCAGWSTATPARSASRCVRAPTCRPG